MSEKRQCVCFGLRKAARAVTQLYDDRLRDTGLRATQLTILSATTNLGPLTVNELADAMVTDPTTLTRNLKVLEKQGLMQVDAGEDRRERQISITRRGRSRLHRAEPLWRKVQEDIVEAIGHDRVTRLLGDLSDMVATARRRS